MPMSFPDMRSLRFAGEVWHFRPPGDGETEANYRAALADFVHDRDLIEAHEIRTGRGHDQWTDEDHRALIDRVRSGRSC